jgi:hypothetical protein
MYKINLLIVLFGILKEGLLNLESSFKQVLYLQPQKYKISLW